MLSEDHLANPLQLHKFNFSYTANGSATVFRLNKVLNNTSVLKCMSSIYYMFMYKGKEACPCS